MPLKPEERLATILIKLNPEPLRLLKQLRDYSNNHLKSTSAVIETEKSA